VQEWWKNLKRNMVLNNTVSEEKEIGKKLEEIEKEYNSLIKVISSGDRNSEQFREAIKKIGYLEEIVNLKKHLSEVNKKISETEEIIKKEEDQDIKFLAEEELTRLIDEKKKIEERIIDFLEQSDPRDIKNAIVEIRAGIGGEEACLFARDLFRMYSKFIEKKGWKIEVLSLHTSDLGGIKEVIFLVKGKGAYGTFKYESGVHRVQRIPKTESYGRIHTSAATVAVFPEVEEKEVKISPSELKIETFRASGHGGQHVNKTSSAVRITHLPTGIVVSCQDERSQLQNRARAMKILRARLQQLYQEEKKSKIDNERKKQVKSGERSEKIRTYNFPQNRVTDHRINFTIYDLENIMEGELEPLIKKLRRELK